MTGNEIIPWRSFRTLSRHQGRTPGIDMRHQHPGCLPIGGVLPWFLVHLENSNQYTLFTTRMETIPEKAYRLILFAI